MKYTKIKKKLLIEKYSIQFFLIGIGCLFMAVSTSLFLLPSQLSTGGFTGIATVVYYIFKIPIGVTMLILNVPLLILGFFRIGKEFLIKSLVGTILLSVFIDFFDRFEPFTKDRLLACIYGRGFNRNRNCYNIKSRWFHRWNRFAFIYCKIV